MNCFRRSAGVGTHGRFYPPREVLVDLVAAARRQVVEFERHLIALDINLKNPIDRLPKPGQFIERTVKKPLLFHAVDVRNDNDQASVRWLRRIEPAKVAGVVRDKHKVPFGGMRRDVPVFPSRRSKIWGENKAGKSSRP
jgi:hypothetical protein